MNQMIQMLMQNKLQQIPQQMMNQMEMQLKRANPQAYQEFQQARKNNADPNQFLNKVTSRFSPKQQQQWNNMMGQFNQQQNNNGIDTQS